MSMPCIIHDENILHFLGERVGVAHIHIAMGILQSTVCMVISYQNVMIEKDNSRMTS